MTPYFILYVADQPRSTAFYSSVLDLSPALNVPGMTEFHLTGGVVLGLMPEAGIVRLLGSAIPDPTRAHGVPRSELYLVVSAPDTFLARAISAGARMLSPVVDRNWGHRAGYALDPDGHVIAFAEPIANG